VLAHIAVEQGPRAGSTYAVKPGVPFLVGAEKGVQVRLDGLAPRHVALVLHAAGLDVVDLAGGVTLDGAPLTPRQPTPVGTGQAIGVAGTLLRVELDGVPEPARASSPGAGPAVAVEGFEVLATLGEGGCGRVVHARRLRDGREVAVKVLKDEVVPGSPDHRRFVREGQVGMRVKSPHVVQVLDAFIDARGQAVIVMELVRGPSLQAQLARLRVLPVGAALRVAEHVASGLAAAHEQGVLHRDVKPSNVLVSPDGQAKLTDFGVAKDLMWTLEALTRSGTGLGTLGYMAPEQITSARGVDAAADLYALGGTLYHALAGRLPIVVRRPRDLPRVLTEQPTPLRSLRPDCPPAVEELVHALLAKDPSARPPSARAVIARLRALPPTP
jgi:serine/threonine protein kinase